MAPTLHIFNPDTDYALGADTVSYTPTAKVTAMRRELAHVPFAYAEAGDVVAALDGNARELALMAPPGVMVADIRYVASCMCPGMRIRPWGWNRALRHTLLSVGVDESLLPSEESISALRALSHRRNTIAFLNEMEGMVEMPDGFELPQELHTAEEAVAYTESHPGCWLKAPWSSSGRGVFPTAGLTEEHIVQWARGIIRRQGSVMGEKNVERALDIATEWEIGWDQVSFIGFSCFHTTGRGRYAGNIELPQEELIKLIGSETYYPLDRIVEAQRVALSRIAPGRYAGPCGIDMAVTTAGQIHPCFEINFRMTMGMATCMKTDRKRLKT